MKFRLFPVVFATCGALAHAAASTPLLDAAYAGDTNRVATLIKSGANVNEANEFGATPMGEAAKRGDTAVLRLLLKAGADPQSANAEGETALMVVARTGNVEAAKLLLKAGAKVDAREKWGGQTAFIWAAAQNQPAMIQLLATHGADVNARSAVRDWDRRMTAEERPKDMHRGGMSALMFAARDGHVDTVRTLLKVGADPDFADPDGSTALIVSLMNGHWDTARLLIDSGADVNLWDWWGQSPLYVAADMNTLPTGARVELPTMDHATGMDIIKLLLARGANPNVRLKLRPPYRNVGQDRLADPAIDYGATPLLRAAKAADVSAMQALLAAGALVDLSNMYGHTPLMMACGVSRGRATPTRGGNQTEEQALDAAKLLLAAGADVNARTSIGETALHGAALHGWMKLAAVLKQAGAGLDAVDADGLSPIDYALGRFRLGFLENKPVPNPQMADALRKLGATRETPNPPVFPPGARPVVVAEVPVVP